MTNPTAGPSPLARGLGFAGLLPFVGLAAALWLGRPAPWPVAGPALLAYGAVIASFLGAIHWGLVMRDAPARAALPLLWGVAPSLLGWVAVMLGGAPGLGLIAALLWVCLAVDAVQYPRHGLRAWLPLRLQLTLVASLSCVAGALAR